MELRKSSWILVFLPRIYSNPGNNARSRMPHFTKHPISGTPPPTDHASVVKPTFHSANRPLSTWRNNHQAPNANDASNIQSNPVNGICVFGSGGAIMACESPAPHGSFVLGCCNQSSFPMVKSKFRFKGSTFSHPPSLSSFLDCAETDTEVDIKAATVNSREKLIAINPAFVFTCLNIMAISCLNRMASRKH